MSAEINADTPTAEECCCQCGKLFGAMEDRYYKSPSEWCCVKCFCKTVAPIIVGGQARTPQEVEESARGMEMLVFVFLGAVMFFVGFALGGWLL